MVNAYTSNYSFYLFFLLYLALQERQDARAHTRSGNNLVARNSCAAPTTVTSPNFSHSTNSKRRQSPSDCSVSALHTTVTQAAWRIVIPTASDFGPGKAMPCGSSPGILIRAFPAAPATRPTAGRVRSVIAGGARKPLRRPRRSPS